MLATFAACFCDSGIHGFSCRLYGECRSKNANSFREGGLFASFDPSQTDGSIRWWLFLGNSVGL